MACALTLLKEAKKRRRSPHGLLYQRNRRRKLGIPSKKMSVMDYLKYQRALKKSRRKYKRAWGT